MKLYNQSGVHVATHQQWPLDNKGVLFLSVGGSESLRYFTENGKAIIPKTDLTYVRVIYPTPQN